MAVLLVLLCSPLPKNYTVNERAGIYCRVDWRKSADISEGNFASVFRDILPRRLAKVSSCFAEQFFFHHRYRELSEHDVSQKEQSS
jgi:hypothetical protein